MGQLFVQMRHDLQLFDVLFMRIKRSFDKITNIAPSGHKYLQNMRSINNDPIIMSTSKTNPVDISKDKSDQPEREEYMPNMFQGLKLFSKLTVPSVQIKTTIKSKRTYLKSLSTLSAFSLIANFFLINFFDIKANKSCIEPNAHRYPQKNRPSKMVSGMTAATVII